MSPDYLTLLIVLPGEVTSLRWQVTTGVGPDERQYVVDFYRRQVIAGA